MPRKIVKEYNKTRSENNRSLPVCLAPYKSLRFLPDGNVTVCCHNNSWTVGKYPDFDIIDIWKSNEINILREKIAKADFSLGCYECLPSFINKSYKSVNPLLYENYKINQDYPVILDFKIATECNLKCIMCSEYSSSAIRRQNNSNKILDIYGDEFINQVKEIIGNVKEARFTGGEPFLNDLYFKLWEVIVEENPNCKISIQTNGTILNDRIKELLKKGNFHLNISVDAAKSDLYEKIRINGNYNKLLNNISFFSQYSRNNNREIGLTACVLQENAFELPEIFKLANSFGANLWYSDVYFPFVNALWVMNYSEISKIVSFLDSCKFDLHTEIEESNYLIYKDMVNRLKTLQIEALRREAHSGTLISSDHLCKKLKKVFVLNINESPEVWDKIEEAFSQVENDKMIDIAEVVVMYGKSDFIFERFSWLNNSEVLSNIQSLCIKS